MERTEGTDAKANREYAAFISYRHKPFDMAVAKKTHALIEKYRVPKALHKGNRLGIAFRDQDELPVSGDLSADICAALDHSRFLIVICTPETPGSLWIEREIEYFLKNHDHEHVFAVLASGDPESSFPYALTHIGENGDRIVEPLAANICAETESRSLRLLSREAIRLFAGMLGCPYDALVRREQKRRQRRLTATAATAFAVLIGYAGILLHSNRLIEGKNRELQQMNDSLNEQKRELQLTESSYLAANAEAALANGDTAHAIEYAVAALPGEENDRPYYAPAEKALMTALGVFNHKQESASVVEVTAELTSPVKSFILAGDGSSVIAVDEYGTVSSWDAFSGMMNWKMQLSSVAGSIITSLYDDALLEADDVNGLICVLYNNVLFALNAENGEVAWKTGDRRQIVQSSRNRADNTLVCLERISTDAYDRCKFDIVVLDAKEGIERQRCSFGREFIEGSPYRKNWEAGNEHNNRAFTEDGTMFTGVIYDEQGGQTFANYYSVDLNKNTVEILYSEEHEEFNIILWMALENTADKQVLTVVKQSAVNRRWLGIEMIDPAAGTLLYEDEAKPGSTPDNTIYTESNAVLSLGTDHLLACACDQLYLIRLSTGEVLKQTGMRDRVLSLFRVDEDFFGFVLADGTYEIGWVSKVGFASSSITGMPVNFGKITGAVPWKTGFIRAVMDGNLIERITGGGYSEGYGYIAVTDAENKRRIRIKHLSVADRLAGDTVLNINREIIESLYSGAVYGFPLLIKNDGTLILASKNNGEATHTYAWHLYDPVSDTLSGPYEYRGESFDFAWPLFDSRKCIFHTLHGGVECYDFDTGETEELACEEQILISEGTLYGERYQFLAIVTKSASALLSADNRVLTAQCDNEKIRIWMNGKLTDTVTLPEDMVWSVQSGLDYDSVFEVGENRYLLLSDYGKGNRGNLVERFALYDTVNRRWTRVEDIAHGDKNRKFILGAEEAVFAVYEREETLRIYRISEESRILEIKTGIALDSIGDCRFIYGDRFIAVCSRDGMLEIYDTENASCVYVGSLAGGMSLCGRITAHPDRQGKRIFIIEHNNHVGACFDIASWTKLGEADRVYGFDARTDSLCRYNGEKLYLRRIPTLEELVAMGQSILD